ncbi:MAG: 1-acyl-sn-glycerol-3-phosphate acyltransferase [Acidimicrobiia bacterium]|nr:1-acyl-sn-glycerol-3-phosphate acyltransferase [Acidimicrobiia bacterium]
MEPVYVVAKGVFYPWLRYGLRWTIEGGHRIPEAGPVLLAGNHVSYLDPLTLAWVADRRGRRVRFLAKAELFRKRGFGFLLRQINQIEVDRGSRSAAASLDSALDALDRGECVTVFPEGTISLDLDPMAGKSGAARLARASGVPVTPVGLWGTHRILFKGRKPSWRWGVAQTAVVGPPVHVGPEDNVREATDRIMASICGCVVRAREIYPDRPRSGDEWWWRDPETAVLRSCRSASVVEPGDDVEDEGGHDSDDDAPGDRAPSVSGDPGTGDPRAAP